MAAANNQIQLSQLDFTDIKSSIINYLKSQDTFKDYNFSGSGLSTLIDILAYNTQYNAYYLNMVANEMFLDTALQRESVVSHAKLLGYTPLSAIASSANVALVVGNVGDSSITLPAYTNFISQSIDGINYNFVTTTSYTENVVNAVANFNNVELKQGTLVNYSFTVDSTVNPNYVFDIPDSNIDTSTLKVSVQTSSTNSAVRIFTLGEDVLNLNGTSQVYFLQEGINENYEIYFGDGIIGKKLDDGNIIRVSFVSTEGTAAAGANSFILLDQVAGFSNTTIYPIVAASDGKERQTIDQIKYTAPKAYSAQGRAVSKEDYISVLQNNKLGYSFDAVNVWGGQENTPPVFGQVFISIKPAGRYNLTSSEKLKIREEVIRPVSVVTVDPVIVDPDYTYLQINANVLYDPKNTNLTPAQLKTNIKAAIQSYSNTALNTFNSTFSISDFTSVVRNTNQSILSAELSVKVQKKLYPSLTSSKNYILNFGVPFTRSAYLSGLSSYPSMQFRDPTDTTTIIDGIYLEEVPSYTGGIESISVTNPGYGYQYEPIVTILGDGVGAKANAVLNIYGSISNIEVTDPGSGYTSAIVQITNQAADTSGQLGAASAVIEGRYGTVRSYYYTNSGKVKTIFDSNAGTIDYVNGVVTLESFNPYTIDNDLYQLTVTMNPSTSLLTTSQNKILTVDPYDTNAININLVAKK